MAVQESQVELETSAGKMQAYFVLPEGRATGPALIVVQEAFGVNGNTKDVCLRLGREGYAAIAPELFHRTAPPGYLSGYDFAKVQPHFAKLTNDGIAEDLAAAKKFVAAHPRVIKERIGVVGFCVGGLAGFIGACRTGLQAAVCFYGGGIVNPRPGLQMRPIIGEKPTCPTLCFFGGKDGSIPASDVAAVRENLAQAGAANEVVVYPEAGHAFFNDERPSYHDDSAKDAWTRTLGFLTKTLRA